MMNITKQVNEKVYLLLLSISFRVKGSLLLLLLLGQVEGGIILSHPDLFLFHSGTKQVEDYKKKLRRALATWFLYASFEGFCCVSITKFRSAIPLKTVEHRLPELIFM